MVISFVDAETAKSWFPQAIEMYVQLAKRLDAKHSPV